MQTTKNGNKIFYSKITRGIRQPKWREDDLEDEVERGPNTGPDSEQVVGYEEMKVVGYDKLVEKEACQ